MRPSESKGPGLELRTGDVLLYAEKRTWFDYLMNWAGSRWTHVALIVVDPPGVPPGTYVVESGRELTPDLLSGEQVYGVQVQFLRAVVDDATFVRQLDPPLTPEQINKLWDVVLQTDTIPYDTDPVDWLQAAMRMEADAPVWKQTTKTFWCSALVAYLYVKLGLLDTAVPWTLVSPEEWAHPKKDMMLKNHSLGPIIKISPVQL